MALKQVYLKEENGNLTALYTNEENITPTDEQISDGIELLKAQNKNLLDNCNYYKNLHEKTKELLIKYIKHVRNFGTDGIEAIGDPWNNVKIEFADEEISELNKLSE